MQNNSEFVRHDPSDVCLVGHALNVHLGMTAYNLGVQEWTDFMDLDILKEAFSGMPEIRDGYLYTNDKPGLGVDINEKLLKAHPAKHEVTAWTQTRLPDGMLCTP